MMELNICGIKFRISDNDIDIYIDGHLYKWIRKANEKELFLSDLTNVECGVNNDFIELFAKDYIQNEQNEQIIKNNELSQKINDQETEIETLKEKVKEEFAKMKDDVTKFEFLQQFLTTRDLIIHK